jgi:hypothetical protein
MKQTFHVGAGLDVFPTAYTVFGDVVLDRRNRHEPLGSLKTDDLSAILDGRIARRLAAKAAAGIHSGDFGCGGCPHLESCVFNGIGAVRNLYGEFEFRAGACYGPASLEPQTLPPHRVSSFNPVEVFRLMVERGMGSGPGHPTGALGAT